MHGIMYGVYHVSDNKINDSEAMLMGGTPGGRNQCGLPRGYIVVNVSLDFTED